MSRASPKTRMPNALAAVKVDLLAGLVMERLLGAGGLQGGNVKARLFRQEVFVT